MSILTSVDTASLKALILLIPASMLFVGSIYVFFGAKTVWSFLQLLGAVCLLVVALTHVFEAFRLFGWMHWGLKQSAGHYLDFWSAILGLTLFPAGYLLYSLTSARK
jgi:hypothetical protein